VNTIAASQQLSPLSTESENALVWKPVFEKSRKSLHAIQSGKYRIFRYDKHFELWRWPDFIGVTYTADAAKSWAARLAFENT
jgi:hypothetical protein